MIKMNRLTIRLSVSYNWRDIDNLIHDALRVREYRHSFFRSCIPPHSIEYLLEIHPSQEALDEILESIANRIPEDDVKKMIHIHLWDRETNKVITLA